MFDIRERVAFFSFPSFALSFFFLSFNFISDIRKIHSCEFHSTAYRLVDDTDLNFIRAAFAGFERTELSSNDFTFEATRNHFAALRKKMIDDSPFTFWRFILFSGIHIVGVFVFDSSAAL